jgi:hypothetical protein
MPRDQKQLLFINVASPNNTYMFINKKKLYIFNVPPLTATIYHRHRSGLTPPQTHTFLCKNQQKKTMTKIPDPHFCHLVK